MAKAELRVSALWVASSNTASTHLRPRRWLKMVVA